MTREQPILIIDDNVNLARGFALVLQRHGYRVHVAHTAEDGLRLAESDHPAAIILDLKMPFINGAGFLYRLRACPKYIAMPVLVVTGAALDEDMRAELLELGAIVKFKPVGVTELVAATAALLQDDTARSSPAAQSM